MGNTEFSDRRGGNVFSGDDIRVSYKLVQISSFVARSCSFFEISEQIFSDAGSRNENINNVRKSESSTKELIS